MGRIIIPSELKDLASKISANMEAKNAQLRAVMPKIISFTGQGALQGEAWRSAKNQLGHHTAIIDGIIGANDSIIADCGTLTSAVGDEDLIEDDILETIRLQENAKRGWETEINRYKYLRNRTDSRLKAAMYSALIRALEIVVGYAQTLINVMAKKIEKISSIEASTNGLFADAEDMFTLVDTGLASIGGTWNGEGFDSPENLNWLVELGAFVAKVYAGGDEKPAEEEGGRWPKYIGNGLWQFKDGTIGPLLLASVGGSDVSPIMDDDEEVHLFFFPDLDAALAQVNANILNASPDAQRLNLQTMFDFAASTTIYGVSPINDAVRPFVERYTEDYKEITSGGPTNLCAMWLANRLQAGGATLPAGIRDTVWNYNKDNKVETYFLNEKHQSYYMGSVTIESSGNLSPEEQKIRAQQAFSLVENSNVAGNILAVQMATQKGKELTHMGGAHCDNGTKFSAQSKPRLNADVYETYVEKRIDDGEEYKVVIHFGLME